MLPEGAIFPIVIDQGADFRETFSIVESDQATPGPLDLTGYVAQAQLRAKQKNDADLLATFVCSIDGLGGTVQIHIPGSVTETFTRRAAFYDVFLVRVADGESTLLVRGAVKINLTVTAVTGEA